MLTRTDYGHIRFVEDAAAESDKPVFVCLNNKTGAPLAEVYFYERWHKYVFLPSGSAVFDESCLTDVLDFLSQL
jgi:hypothetical protein